jgi:antitoxin MazE
MQVRYKTPSDLAGRIMIETEIEPTLDQMLAAFNPKKHGGEVMTGASVGVEAFADGNP